MRSDPLQLPCRSDTTTPAQDTGEQTSEDPHASGSAVPDSSDALEEEQEADAQATPTSLPDTDELSAFRHQWKEELRLGPTLSKRREGREESDLQAAGDEEQASREHDLSSDSSPRVKSEQGSPEKDSAQPSSCGREDLQSEV